MLLASEVQGSTLVVRVITQCWPETRHFHEYWFSLGRLNLAQPCHKFPAKLLGEGTTPIHNGRYKGSPNHFTCYDSFS